MATIISGTQISKEVRAQLGEEVKRMTAAGVRPGLAVVIVGNDPASKIYVRNKHKGCEELGILSEVYELPETTTQKELTDLIRHLNGREEIDGILVQLPLPEHIEEKEVIEASDPGKDDDAGSVSNAGKIMVGEYSFVPCTPAGVMELLRRTGVKIAGKACVVIGRSNIVGKPMGLLLLEQNGTVTICHSRTENLAAIARSADILVSAVGKAKFVTADMVKDGAVVIDVDMNRDENGKLCGDVDFAAVEPKASFITPVPGGVGPMTITMLLKNTVNAAKRRLK